MNRRLCLILATLAGMMVGCAAPQRPLTVTASGIRSLQAGPVPSVTLIPVIDARRYGVSTTLANNTAKLQAAVNAAGVSGQPCTVYMPAGTLKFTGSTPVSIPSNCVLAGQGMGATVLQVQAGRGAALIDVDGKSNVGLYGFSIIKATGSNAVVGAYGVYVRGNSADVTAQRVSVDAQWRGFQIAGGEGTVAGTCRRIAFTECTSTNAPQQYGYNVDDCDTVNFTRCHARTNGLDGFKLRKATLNVTVRDCSASGNGTATVADGMDCYAGGDTFLIDGFTGENNSSNCLTVKTGDLNMGANVASFGYVRNARIFNVRSKGHTSGYGLYLTLNDPADTTEPLVSGVTVGDLYSEGDLTGLYLNARNVKVRDPYIKKSRQDGIVVSSRAMDVEINDAMTVACGQQTAATYNGILVAGASNVRISRPLFLGKDADTIAVDADYAAQTAYTKFGVQVTSGSPVFVFKPRGRNLTSNVVNDAAGATGGVVIVDQDRSQGAPSVNGAYGTLGSTLRLENSGTGEDGYDFDWVKVSGNRATPTGGWTRRITFSPVTSLPTATAARRGAVLTVQGGTGVADVTYQCVKTNTETYVWQQVTN